MFYHKIYCQFKQTVVSAPKQAQRHKRCLLLTFLPCNTSTSHLSLAIGLVKFSFRCRASFTSLCWHRASDDRSEHVDSSDRGSTSGLADAFLLLLQVSGSHDAPGRTLLPPGVLLRTAPGLVAGCSSVFRLDLKPCSSVSSFRLFDVNHWITPHAKHMKQRAT